MKSVRFLMIFFFSTFFTKVFSQVSSTVSDIGIQAKVIAPISIEKEGSTSLDFGTITRSSIQGTVILSPNGEIETSGGVSVLSSLGSTVATFTVTGENNNTYSISLPTSNITLTRLNETETMIVNDFQHDSTQELSGSGIEVFHVGATLTVNADQVPGDYSGEFSITVAYQ